MRNALVLCVLLQSIFLFGCSQRKQFSNPLLPSGADPWSITLDGNYYYTHTMGDRIVLWKTSDLTNLAAAEKKTVWTPPAGEPYSHELWAPELHFIDDKWYVYFAADSGNNNSHRLWVLENSSRNPLEGTWEFKGKLTDPTDKWAIDGSVIKLRDQLYLAWSGWEGDVNGQQNIYIAKMENPWTVSGNRVKLSSPDYSWERYGELDNPNDPDHVYVNEGPQFLKHGSRIFIIYSASGCWTDHYALGMLSADADADLLSPDSWEKSPEPVFFADGSAAGTINAGHNSFFKSPDGTEDWILYHANEKPGQGCGRSRSPRAQKFGWQENGFPDFGTPIGLTQQQEIPSQ